MFIFQGHEFRYNTSSISDVQRVQRAARKLQAKVDAGKLSSLEDINREFRRTINEMLPGQDAANKILGDTDDVSVVLEAYTALALSMRDAATSKAKTLTGKVSAALSVDPSTAT